MWQDSRREREVQCPLKARWVDASPVVAKVVENQPSRCGVNGQFMGESMRRLLGHYSAVLTLALAVGFGSGRWEGCASARKTVVDVREDVADAMAHQGENDDNNDRNQN